MRGAILGMASMLLVATTARAGGVLRVNGAALPGGDGMSWETAYDDLQDALAAAVDGDELWIAAGTYTPAPPGGARSVSFAPAAGVSLYGGFAGDERARDERDPDANETVLSGDLNGDDLPPDGGGFANGFGSVVTIENSIVWANVSPGQPTARAQVHDLDGGDSSMRYSCVEGLLETIPGEDPPDPADFPGCHDLDPGFVDGVGRDFRLDAGSPCIDAGDNAAVPAFVLLDLDGATRFADDPAAPDVGAGTAPIVDMGAYERQVAGAPGDVDGDGIVGFGDLVIVLSSWGSCVGCAADLDGDDAVGFTDLVLVLSNWSS